MDFFAGGFRQDNGPAHLDAAARTAGAAADKHDEQQHAPGELWPQGEIRSSIAGSGYDGGDLEKGIEEGFGAIDGRYIPGDQQYRCGDDAKIPAQLLVFKKVLYLAQQQEKVERTDWKKQELQAQLDLMSDIQAIADRSERTMPDRSNISKQIQRNRSTARKQESVSLMDLLAEQQEDDFDAR